MRIGLISDTHGFLDKTLWSYLEECDEIWHAGDIGTLKVAQELAKFRPLRAVWGNIDGSEIRHEYPESLDFELQGLRVYMIHIGGYPGRYAKGVKTVLNRLRPQLFVCGHSHIVRAMHDERLNLIHFNPGACGRQGFHLEKTIMRFTINQGALEQFQICRLGPR